MNLDALERAKRIFDQVVEMPEMQRAAFIENSCAGNAIVRNHLDQMLAEFYGEQTNHNDARFPSGGAEALIGKTVSHYRILEILGSGGFGVVYKAQDTRLGRFVALKLLTDEMATDSQALDRFRREASTASALNHPHVCTIYDIDQDQGRHFIVMELLKGKTLKEYILEGPMNIADVVKFGVQIASALAAVHAKGIIHRDIKPANIFITSERQVKLLDFGVAKLSAAHLTVLTGTLMRPIASGSDLTTAGALLGTLVYMSPEQARGQELDERTDLFSFGVVLYEMVTGQGAFSGGTPAVVVDGILNRMPRSVLDLNPSAPPKIGAVINKALEKDPENRYQTASQLSTDLQSCDVAPGAIRSRAGTRRLVSYISILVLAMVVILAWMSRRGGSGKNPSAPPLIAVHELRNLSSDPGQSYFAAGMTEEIRGQLSKISTLRLLSRDAVGKYDVERMVADLGVSSIVEGSVRLDRNRVRITVELIDATDQHTQWSDQYERDLSDIFAVQTDVALQIARALQANLSPAERERITKRPTENLEAYDLFLKSRQFSNSDENAQTGMKLLERALILDPRFTLAKATLAYRTFFQAYRTADNEGMSRAIALANEAADVDPILSTPHFVLGSVYSYQGRDAQSRLAFMRALELDPNFVEAMNNLSLNEFQFGRLDDSLQWARRSFAISAHAGNDYYHIGIPLTSLRDDDASLRWMTRAEQRIPDAPRIQILLANVEVLRGAGQIGLARLRMAAERWPKNVEVQTTRAELAFLAAANDAETLTEQLYRTDPGMVGYLIGETLRVRRAYFLKQRGDPGADSITDEVLRLGREQLAAGNESPSVSIDMAAAFMIRKDRNAALESLAAAVKRGYRDYGILSGDPIFAPLAQEARYRALIDNMRTDVARQRQRARDRGLLDLSSLDSELH
jgi:serine/threonine protein kinase/Tfp pilus assembly protein PilF